MVCDGVCVIVGMMVVDILDEVDVQQVLAAGRAKARARARTRARVRARVSVYVVTSTHTSGRKDII